MEIENIKPGHGFVLVEIPPAISTIKTGIGVELYVDTSFEPERYSNVWATVLAVPAMISTKTMKEDRNKRNILSKDTDVRLQKGDKVYFHYLTIKNATKNHERGTYFEENGKRYALLPYSSLFFAVRKGLVSVDVSVLPEETTASVIIEAVTKTGMMVVDSKNDISKVLDVQQEYVMLNDWLLIEPVRKGQHIEHIPRYGNIIVDDELSKGGIIVTTNEPYRSSEGIVRACPANSGVEIGDRVVFEKESDVPVEYDLTRTLDKPYYRMKSEDIIARRVGENMIQLVKDYTLIIKDAEAGQTNGGFYIPEVAQEKPFQGEIKMVGPDCKEVFAGNRVIFERGAYTDFPWGENEIGCLVPESKIQIVI